MTAQELKFEDLALENIIDRLVLKPEEADDLLKESGLSNQEFVGLRNFCVSILNRAVKERVSRATQNIEYLCGDDSDEGWLLPDFLDR